MLSRLFSLTSFLFGPRKSVRPRRNPPARQPVDDGMFHGAVPVMDNYSLISIESRVPSAQVRDLQRWISEIERQIPNMRPTVRHYACDLLIKLRAAVADQRLAPLQPVRTQAVR